MIFDCHGVTTIGQYGLKYKGLRDLSKSDMIPKIRHHCAPPIHQCDQSQFQLQINETGANLAVPTVPASELALGAYANL